MASDVLRLTGVIDSGDTPDIFVGHIKEIGGIVVRGRSEEEVLNNLREATEVMLEYNREEALNLLREQNLEKTPIFFAPAKKLEFELELA